MSCRRHLFNFFIYLTSLCLCSAGQASANEPRPSAMLMGPIGLNTVPNARMDPAGTMRMGIGTIDPYVHSFAGLQITDFFYAGIRQSAEKDSETSNAKRLYPGMDFKIRLNEEGRYDPEVALGFLSAFGHKKTASEYIALSKRYRDIDFTLGMGWGRLAGDGHLSNPMKTFSSHFGNNRSANNEVANTVHDWFTGDQVGFFAGVEYQTPIDGVSLKADWGANPYTVEKSTIAGYSAPAPWSLGINYSPAPWVDGMIGLAGSDTVMARLSLQSQAMDWLVQPFQTTPPPRLRPRGEPADHNDDQTADDGIRLSNMRTKNGTISADLHLQPHQPLAYQLGRAARHVANRAGQDVETISITPLRGKIKSRTFNFSRRDLEQAAIHHQGSPEEIWRNTRFEAAIIDPDSSGPMMLDFNLALKNDLSLSEDDTEYLYRTAAVARLRGEAFGLFGGADIKLNIGDNLDAIDDRVPNLDVTRSDIDAYTKQRLYLDRAYSGWRTSLNDDVFLSFSGGLLEEMFAGYGGEILYRPFGKTFAVGLEGWQVYKRDPSDMWGTAPSKEPRTTAHLNLFYELPNTGVTAYAKVGKYLGGDHGATLGLDHTFNNGIKLGGFVTASKEADYDTLGGATHFYSGVQLNVPLGHIPYVPEGSEIATTFHPLARDAGQFLDNPEPLYSVTEPMSYRSTSRSWHRLLD